MNNKNSILAGLTVLGGLLCVSLYGMDGTVFYALGTACGVISGVSAGILYRSAGQLRSEQVDQRNRLLETQTEKMQCYIDCMKMHQANVEMYTKAAEVASEQMQSTLSKWLPVIGQIQRTTDGMASVIEEIRDALNELITTVREMQCTLGDCNAKVVAMHEKVDSIIACADSIFTQSKAAFLEAIKEWENSNRQLTDETREMAQDEMCRLDEMLDEFHEKLNTFMKDLRIAQEDADRDRKQLYTSVVRGWGDRAEDLSSRNEQLVEAQRQSFDKLCASYESFQNLTDQMLNTMNRSTAEDNELVRQLMRWSEKNGR